jgi:hypothetical protein
LARSLEAVVNTAVERFFFLSLLCAEQEGVGRDCYLRGGKSVAAIGFITRTASYLRHPRIDPISHQDLCLCEVPKSRN